MTAMLCSVAVLLCVVTLNEACSCAWAHPQEHFCFAEFVIRAKVLSQEAKIDFRVFKLEILETFKGASRLKPTVVSGQRGLFAKAYTVMSDLCGVFLTNGTIYLLGGYIWKGKPQLDLCRLNEEWSQVTPDQRVGVNRVYGQNCECQISPCYGGNGCGDLKGCADDSEPKRRNSSYCFKNTDGTACFWSNTSPFQGLFPSSFPSTDSSPGLFPSPFPSKLPRETPRERDLARCRFATASTSKATNITLYFVVLYLLIFV